MDIQIRLSAPTRNGEEDIYVTICPAMVEAALWLKSMGGGGTVLQTIIDLMKAGF